MVILMAIKSRGRRAAPTSNAASSTSSVDVLNISRGGKKAPEALPDGEHTITILSAAHRVAKSGSVVILVDAVSGDGVPVKLRPLLVSSPGGSSDLTIQNLEILEALAGAEENATLGDILGQITQRTVTVDMAEVVDQRTGATVNDIVDVIASESAL